MSLHEVLRNRGPVLLDGANGTQLAAMGLEPGGEQNLLHPEAVRSIHAGYARAGSWVITTNTLAMNRIFLESHGRGSVDVAEVNRAGAALALSVARGLPAPAGAPKSAAASDDNGGRFVIGDISSTGQLLQPYGDATEAQLIECFEEQASILASSGVDGFIIETYVDLREALCALRACRQVSALPVIASISFSTLNNGGRTVMGNSVEGCALALSKEGADALGANCGELDPFEMAEVVSRFRRYTDLPLVAQPNAGKPRLVNGKAVFDLSPEEFARGIQLCVKNGATLVGGCCGTSPEHIQAAAALRGGLPPQGSAALRHP